MPVLRRLAEPENDPYGHGTTALVGAPRSGGCGSASDGSSTPWRTAG